MKHTTEYGLNIPLKSLPGEVRNAIYEEYAAVLTLRLHGPEAVAPALAHTCRQIRRELMSILHRSLFYKNEIEARVVDYDFLCIIKFLEKLEEHDREDGHVRRLKIYLDVMTPAATYGPWRMQWCVDARYDIEWYNQDLGRWWQIASDRRVPVRAKILGKPYDLSYIVRFPHSFFFTEKERMANDVWFRNFRDSIVRNRGMRAMLMNDVLERALSGAPSRQWVDRYWANYQRWITRLQWLRTQPHRLEISTEVV